MPPPAMPPPDDQVTSVEPSTKDRAMGALSGVIKAGGGGDASGMTPIDQAIARHQQGRLHEAQMHRSNMSRYAAALMHNVNPDTGEPLTPEDRAKYQNWFQSARDAYTKAAGVNKETKAAVAKNNAIVDHVMTQGQGGGQPPAANPAGATASPQAASTGASPSPAPSGGSAPATPPAGLPPPPPPDGGAATKPAVVSPLTPEQRAILAKTPPGTSSPYPRTSPPPPPPQDAAAAPPSRDDSYATAQYAGQDLGKRMDARDKADTEVDVYRREEEIHNKHEVEREAMKEKSAAELAAIKAKGGTGTIRIGPGMSMKEAQREAAELGTEFENADGDPIDVTKFGPEMKMVSVVQGSHVFYMPANQAEKEVTVGNMKYRLPEFATDVGTEGKPQGVARVATSSSSVQPGFNAQGQPTPTVKSRTSTPQTTGAIGAGAPAASTRATGGATQPSGGAPVSPAATSASGATPSRAPAARSAAGKSGGGGDNIGYTVADAQRLTKSTLPTRESARQIFGSPDDPSFKGLQQFAPVFDDPAKRAKLNAALEIAYNGMDTKLVEDGSDGTFGGLSKLAAMKLGLPNALASASASVKQKAIKGLTGPDGKPDPELLAAYDATISSAAAMVGLRSLTGASNAQASVGAIGRELPGLTTTSAYQFYDQLNNIAQEVKTSSERTPGFTQQEKDFYSQNAERIRKLRDGAKGGKRTSGGLPKMPGAPPKTADEYLRFIGAR